MKKPVPKMPRGRQLRMVGLAFTFELLQTLGALLVVFAPVLICYFAKYWVADWSGSEWAGDIACYVSSIGLVASYAVGVGVGIAMFGWIIGAAVSLLSILVFTAWFWMIGVSFLDKLETRVFIMAGASILEFLPFVNVLPWSTASIWLITESVRKDDAKAVKEYEMRLAKESAADAREAAEMHAAPPTPANDNEYEEKAAA